MASKNKNVKTSAFTKWFGPLLDALRQLGGSGRPKEVVQQIAINLCIPDSILEETTKTGILRFHNQVAWARQYLVWEGLLDDSKRGVWTLTPLGQRTSITEQEAREIFLKWVDVYQKSRKEKAKRILSQNKNKRDRKKLNIHLLLTCWKYCNQSSQRVLKTFANVC